MAEKHERALWIRSQLTARRADLRLSLRRAAARISDEMPDGERGLVNRLARPKDDESST